MEKAKDFVPDTDTRILVATHKAVEDMVKKAAAEVFAGKTVGTVHFMGNRGLNEFKEYQTVICFGTFNMNPLEAWKKASAIFPDDPDRQAEYMQHLSDSETLQTIHRIRPVNGSRTVILIAKNWIPGLPEPENVRDLRKGKTDQLEEAYSRIKEFYEVFGFVTRDMGLFTGVGCRNDKDYVKIFSERFPDIVMRLKTQKKVGFSVINIFTITQNPTFFAKYSLKTPAGIIFGDNKYWAKIITRLKADFPDAGYFRTCQNHSGKWSDGFGTVDRIQAFSDAIGTGGKLEPEKWEQIRPEKKKPGRENPFHSLL